MRSSVLYLSSLCFRLIPETRLFGLKRLLLQFAGARIGAGVRICSSARVLGAGKLCIGADTWVGHDVMIVAGSAVTIGRNVDIGPRVYIGTGTHEISDGGVGAAGRGLNRDVSIEDGVWLGVGSCVLPGVTVRVRSIVAAGAVVNQDVAAATLVGGVPAKLMRALVIK